MKFDHFESMFNSAGIGIILINQHGMIELINKTACAMFGYKSEELFGHKIEMVLPDALRQAHERHREGYFKKPTSRTMGSNLELYGKQKSTEVFPVEISLGHYTVEGEIKAIAFISDISVRKTKEQELNRLKLELEDQVLERTAELAAALAKETEINDMKSRFVSMASHEFRTPLTSVLSSANLATKYVEMDKPEKILKHLKRIEESSNNLVGILNDFLSLEKIDSGKEVTDPIIFDVDDCLKSTMTEMDDHLKPNQVFEYTYKGNKEIESDPRILKQVMVNLISNAIKYSDPDSKIEIHANSSSDSLSIEVEDHGIGIPEKEQVKMFTKFFRARNVENIQGTGLGLTIVQRYLNLINGTIEFKSIEGKGTTFKIDISL